MVEVGGGSRVWAQPHHSAHRQTDNTFGAEESEQVHKPSEESVNCFYLFFTVTLVYNISFMCEHYISIILPPLTPCPCPSGNNYSLFCISMLWFGTTGGNVNWCTNYGNSMETAQKINRSSMWPSYPISGYLSKEHKNTHQQKQRQPYAHHNIIHNRRDMEVTWVPINGWMGKDVLCIHTHKRNTTQTYKRWNLFICNKVGPWAYYAWWNKCNSWKSLLDHPQRDWFWSKQVHGNSFLDILVEATDMPWAAERRVREWVPMVLIVISRDFYLTSSFENLTMY